MLMGEERKENRDAKGVQKTRRGYFLFFLIGRLTDHKRLSILHGFGSLVVW